MANKYFINIKVLSILSLISLACVGNLSSESSISKPNQSFNHLMPIIYETEIDNTNAEIIQLYKYQKERSDLNKKGERAQREVKKLIKDLQSI